MKLPNPRSWALASLILAVGSLGPAWAVGTAAQYSNTDGSISKPAVLIGSKNGTSTVYLPFSFDDTTYPSAPPLLVECVTGCAGGSTIQQVDVQKVLGAAISLTNGLFITPTTGATFAVTGTFWQTTQPVSGTFWQATQPVSGTFWQTTQPVSGTFWQATQPVSGTFWQATQPVSVASQGSPTGSVPSLVLFTEPVDKNGNAADFSTPAPTTPGVGGGIVPITISVNGASTSNVAATLAATSGKTTYITGFSVTCQAEATTVANTTFTLAGLVTGTQTYEFAELVVSQGKLDRQFTHAVPASAQNTTIVGTLVGVTAGATCAVNMEGYQL
jgi:hypothetical protein